MTAALMARYSDLPWMRNAQFDTWFILGLIGIPLTVLAVLTLEPALFMPILLLDLWLLGYHHVISTFTRLTFDKQSYRENKFIIYGITPIVAAVTGLIVWVAGIWAIVTIYFYWQWFHYARQSWGISRTYRGKDPKAAYENGWFDQTIFYAVPVAGILSRSAEQNDRFLGLELWSVPVPQMIADLSLWVALGLVLMWVALRVRAAMEGRLAIVHTLYMASHFFIFGLGYIFITDINVGWLMINIWHNAQYILFVWMFNTKRFKNGIDPDAKFLSYISQPGRLLHYLLVCVAITGVVYWGILGTIDWLFFAGVSATIVLYQIVNFHHYIVDSLIWKVRKPKMQETLGLSSTPAE